ncbi:MAG TPA: glycosyltransferase family 39 protein, partial [Chloroflexota bacterium]|nr:glycosyltransferase family 39 protein [Chloroflexota bacterium]
MAASGEREYAVRFLSLMAGMLVVPLLFALGRRLFNTEAGLLAAVCGAVSPLLVHYSQETRMYAQVTLFGLLSTYLLVRAAPAPVRASRLERTGWLHGAAAASAGTRRLGGALGTGPGWAAGRWSSWIAYGLAAAACLYSQYIGALVLAFQGLRVLCAHRKAIAPFALAGGAAAAAFVPWLLVAGDSLLSWPSTNAFEGGFQLFGDAAYRYVEGVSRSFSGLGIGLTVAVCGIAVFGFVSLRFFGRLLARVDLRRTSEGQPLTTDMRARAAGALQLASAATSNVWLPVLYVAVPLALMFLLGLRKPLYNPKFALVALPGFLLLLGVALSVRWPPRWVGLALVLAAAGYGLNNYYANPQYARDDYRGLAHFISTSERPGDAILLDAPGQEQIFPYYYKGPLPQIGLPTERPVNQDATSAKLQQLNTTYKRLWLVLYGTNGSDPDSYVEHWLASKDFEVENQWFGDVRLTAFAVPSSAAPESQPADATLGNFAHLSGYTLTPPQVASGDVLQLGLKWQAVGPPPGNEKVFTHVIDAEGNIWAQRDSDPAGGARPTSWWKPGDRIEDNYGLLLLPGTPPGQYQLEVGMYDPAQPSRRQPVTAGGSGDRLLLGGVQVTRPERPPSLDELRIPHPLDRSFGAVRLL